MPAATPIPLLNRALVVGDNVTVLGIGGTGTGSSGFSSAATDFANPWRAITNVVDYVYGTAGLTASFDFDAAAPFRTDEMFNVGSMLPTALEGAVFPGDSGGAWLVMTEYGWALGATTVGSAASDGANDASYGDVSSSTDTYFNSAWLQSHGATVIGTVPEPSVICLLIFAGASCVFAKRSALPRSPRF